MLAVLTIIFLIFGLIIGSFLNVVIFRLNTRKSFGGRSACLSCRSQLTWYELVPIFSFLFLAGRCRNCHTKISAIYPVVEFTTGLIFAGLFLKFQDIFLGNTVLFAVTYAYYAAIFSLLVVIAFYDLKHKIIPDILALFFGVMAFVGLFLFGSYGFSPHVPSFLDLTSGFWVAVPFAAIWYLSSGTWMGLGDAKLALGLGWLLGISRLLSGVIVAFWFGAALGIMLVIFSKKHNMKSEIPFAPFLVLGAILAFLFELHLFPVF